MTLYWETHGTGHPIMALHGWGTNSSVWKETTQALCSDYQVITLDLPGFGRSAPLHGEYSLARLASIVANTAPQPTVLIGWSMGGMIALEVALVRPERVQALVLVASTPRFVTGDDWSHGLPIDVLTEFSKDLEEDYRSTLLRFLVLQAGRGERAREVIKRLRQDLFQYGEPDIQALRGGLRALRTTDLRERLCDISCPTLVMLGEQDTLVPAAVAGDLLRLRADWPVEVIPKSGHAPFLSHAREFLKLLTMFLDEIR